MINTDILIHNFIKVADLSGVSLSADEITAEVLQAPHKPPKNLPIGKMGVYVFSLGEKCLKVGKVGPRSKARYTSQHYNPRSSNSNLSKSILKTKADFGGAHLDENNIEDWVKENTDRVNFIFDESLGIPILSLFESYLQCHLKPKFEGFESQK
jgi:hypothetical protein